MSGFSQKSNKSRFIQIVRIWFYRFSKVAHYLTKNLIPSDHSSHGFAKCIMHEKLSWKNQTPLKSFIRSRKWAPTLPPFPFLQRHVLSSVHGAHSSPLPLSYKNIRPFLLASSLSIQGQSRHTKHKQLKTQQASTQNDFEVPPLKSLSSTPMAVSSF